MGVNRFRDDSGTRIPILRIDQPRARAGPAVEGLARAARARRSRGGTRVAAASCCRRREPDAVIVECVDRGVTLGEISDVLRSIFGEYREQVVV